MGGEGVSSGSHMTHHRETRKEAVMPPPLLTPKVTILFGTWNVRTMYEAAKSAQIAAEMTTYNLSILGLCETRWLKSRCIQLLTGQTVLYSGHDSANASHTEGVGFMLTPQAAKSLIGWNPYHPGLSQLGSTLRLAKSPLSSAMHQPTMRRMK